MSMQFDDSEPIGRETSGFRMRTRRKIDVMLGSEDGMGRFPGVDNVQPGDVMLWKLRWVVLRSHGYEDLEISRMDHAPIMLVTEWANRHGDWLISQFGDVDKGLSIIRLELIANLALGRAADDGPDSADELAIALNATVQSAKIQGFTLPIVGRSMQGPDPSRPGISGPEVISRAETQLAEWRRKQLDRIREHEAESEELRKRHDGYPGPR